MSDKERRYIWLLTVVVIISLVCNLFLSIQTERLEYEAEKNTRDIYYHKYVDIPILYLRIEALEQQIEALEGNQTEG